MMTACSKDKSLKMRPDMDAFLALWESFLRFLIGQKWFFYGESLSLKSKNEWKRGYSDE